MGNCLLLRARGWGIDRQVRTELQIPGGVPGGGMVTGRIEPCIITFRLSVKILRYIIQTHAFLAMLFVFKILRNEIFKVLFVFSQCLKFKKSIFFSF